MYKTWCPSLCISAANSAKDEFSTLLFNFCNPSSAFSKLSLWSKLSTWRDVSANQLMIVSHLVDNLPKLVCNLVCQCWCSCLLCLLLPWWIVPGCQILNAYTAEKRTYWGLNLWWPTNGEKHPEAQKISQGKGRYLNVGFLSQWQDLNTSQFNAVQTTLSHPQLGGGKYWSCIV